MNRIVTVDQVWQSFQEIPDLMGMSFSGGEPFAQAVALAELASRIQATGKTVLCWTGYRLEQLQSGQIPGAKDFLERIDLLIDGLFMEPQAENLLLRGSKNQQLHFLSGKITQGDLVDIPRQEWIVTPTRVSYTGFPL